MQEKACNPFRTALPRCSGTAVVVPRFLFAFVVIGCSAGPESPTAPPTESLGSITIQMPESDVLAAGGTLSLTAIVRSVSGKPPTGEPIEWRTSHPQVASVDPSGVVKSLGSPGPVSITARVQNITSPSVEIRVTPAAPAAVSTVGSYPASIFSGNALNDSVRIEVRDRFGNLVPGVTVDFAGRPGMGQCLRIK